MIQRIIISLLFVSGFANAVPEAGSSPLIPQGIISLDDGNLSSPYALVVDKSKRKLYVIENSPSSPRVVGSFDSDLGKNPGPKHALNDAKTPEGIYFFEKWIDGSELDPEKYGIGAFVTDYPNFFDKREGRGGYGIWLHAIADKTTLERGSRGCVVVRNDTLKKLTQYVAVKETPFLIFDKINWVSFDSQTNVAKGAIEFLSQWKKAWETKEMQSYISYYADDFNSMKMNRNKWLRFKTGIAEKYDSIRIKLSQPMILTHNDGAIIRFFQEYQSSEKNDFGIKTLYLTKDDKKGYIIHREEWRSSDNSKAQSLFAAAPNKL